MSKYLWMCLCVIIFMNAGCSSTPSYRPSNNDAKQELNAMEWSGYRNWKDIPDAVPKKEAMSKYGNPDSYVALSVTYKVMKSVKNFHEKGLASWYGSKFEGKKTSSGEIFQPEKMTAAHRVLPLPCYIKVTNLENGRTAIVKVNDRGPFKKDRIIDLSKMAATKLGMVGHGTARVSIELISY